MRTGTILFAFTFLLSQQTLATHIVGGDIHYECLGGNEYYVVLKVYRDCQTGVSPYDDPACVGVFNQSGILIENIQISLSSATITNLPIDTGDPCLQAPAGLCVTEAIYTATVTLEDSPGGYTFAYQRCCRNTTIINCASNDDIGMTVYAQIPDASLAQCNSNPAFTQFPPVVICLNEPFVFDHSATDLDGDSLVYEFCNPLDENVGVNYICPPGAPNYPLINFYPQYSADYPLDANPAFVIDPFTGLMTGTPTLLGKFVVGVCVKEYRNGLLISTTNRDFQFNIAPCSLDVIADIDPSPPCLGLDMTFNNGGNGDYWFWDFGDSGTSADTANTLTGIYTYPAEGIYNVTLISNPGYQCADTATLNVPVFPPLEVTITPDGPTCVAGDWIFLFTSSGNYDESASFEWDFNGGEPATFNGEAPPEINFSGAGAYNVELYVTTTYCVAEDLIQINVPPAPEVTILPQSEFCMGLEIQFTSETIGADIYLWDMGESSSGDTSTEANPSYIYDDYGTYTVTLTVNAGTECQEITEIQVVILPPDPIEPQYIITEPGVCDTVPIISVLWTGSGATEIEWDFGDGGTSVLEQDVHEYDDEGSYIVTLTAYNEICDYEETVNEEIFLSLGPIHAPVIIPNIFTPNNDGRNEVFRIFYLGEDDTFNLPPGKTIFDYMEFYHMKVYDRWGVLMYDSQTDGTSWDGQRNRDSSESVYYYIVQYQRFCLDDDVNDKEGYVHLVRGN